MSAPDRDTQRVKDWLHRSTPTPPDAERSVDVVMTTLFRQTQLQPRVSFHLLGGRGRGEGGSSMFSAIRFGVAASLVALLGGLFAIGAGQPQADEAPGAAAPASPSATADETLEPVAAITGRIVPGRVTREADEVTQPTLPETIWSDYVWSFVSDTNDQRLNGMFEFTQNLYLFRADDRSSGSVHSGVGRITNDDGSWVSEFHGFSQPGKDAYLNPNFALQFTGQGGYEGLSAMLLMTPVPGSHWDVEGIIFPGSMPELPPSVDPPEAE